MAHIHTPTQTAFHSKAADLFITLASVLAAEDGDASRFRVGKNPLGSIAARQVCGGFQMSANENTTDRA
jgi:hypothetical protein